MLFEPVIITGHGTCANISIFPKFCIANVAKVIDFCILGNPGIFDFDKIANSRVFTKFYARSQSRIGSNNCAACYMCAFYMAKGTYMNFTFNGRAWAKITFCSITVSGPIMVSKLKKTVSGASKVTPLAILSARAKL